MALPDLLIQTTFVNSLFSCIVIIGHQGMRPHHICNGFDPFMQYLSIFPLKLAETGSVREESRMSVV
jgi:hypothetical protein